MSFPDNWSADFLGPDFESLTLPLGADPDGEGDVEATLVRYHPEPISTRPALLWVHGMTDYFFHTHVAEFFHNQGFAFYAIDLRKCGRSRRDGQHWHYVSEMSFYFGDLDAALGVIAREHPSLTPIAHSTAGIIVPLWLDYLRRQKQHKTTDNNAAPSSMINSLILNSPWLDMMGVSPTLVNALRPVVNVVGKKFPMIPFPGGGLTAAGESIHADYHGEWDYRLDYKPLPGHKKYLGWLRTVLESQHLIHQGTIDIGVPALVLTSQRSHLNKPYSHLTDTADAVIDVHQTQKWAPKLGHDIDIHPILGARHDVFLSLPPARAEAFETSLNFLRAHTG